MKLLKVLTVLLVVGLFAVGAQADTIPTILPTSSQAYPGYGQGFAIDGSLLTDFASNSQGTNTHLDFDFGAPVTFTSITYTNRTSSGGANGSQVMGTYDFVTSFEYIFATDPGFTNVVGTVLGTLALPACADPSTHLGCTLADIAQFQLTTAVSGITAQYVEWQVLTTNGVNPGAAELSFSTTPEPGSLLLFGTGIVGVMGAIRRKFIA